MRSLLHMPLDPPSRMVRVLLAEKALRVRLVATPPGEDRETLAAQNPAMTLPVLIDEAPTGEEISASPAWAIAEYLEDVYDTPSLSPATSAGRAEARRLVSWFCDKFENEVINPSLRPKINGERVSVDDAGAAKTAERLCWHLDYLSWLLENRDWLAGASMTIADIAGAAYLSTADYFGLIPWRDFTHVKEWYARLKSRPSFRTLLDDRVDGAPPAAHYANLDF
ncbi:MAG: glutathione S-transferase family protein [Pseudomonadota bacterium]